MNPKQETQRLAFQLENFEGPLDLLIHLIQKEEIDVRNISMQTVTHQLISCLESTLEIDEGAEALATASALLLMKSRKLLPKNEEEIEEDEAPRHELFEHLLEYCRIKEVAKTLSQRESEQSAFYQRPSQTIEKPLPSGLEALSLVDLTTVLQDVISRAKKQPQGVLKDEQWHVSTKIEWLKRALSEQPKLLFSDVFHDERPKEELIVFFLALLELMKLQHIQVVKDQDTLYFLKASS